MFKASPFSPLTERRTATPEPKALRCSVLGVRCLPALACHAREQAGSMFGLWWALLLLLVFASPATAKIDLQDIPTSELVKQIAERSSAGEWAGNRMIEASRRGMAAAIEAANYLDEDDLPRSRRMLELISLAGRQRALPEELLRLYDQVAHNVFYSPEGAERQAAAAAVLTWEGWPENAAEACVRAAPGATLSWLDEQASSETPDNARLASLMRTWARWITYGNERQHQDDLRRVVFASTRNPAITGNGESQVALLGLIGAAGADSTIEFVKQCVTANSETVRAAACDTLGQLGGPTALEILASIGDAECSAVQTAIAHALKNYSESAEAGRVAVKLFEVSDDPGVRREIMLGAQDSRWPETDTLITMAINSPEDGVLGAAFGAVRSGNVGDELRNEIVELAMRGRDPDPALIHALGEAGDPRAVPVLERWLAVAKNAAIRVKLVLALEKVGGEEASRVIAEVIANEADENVMQQALRAAGEMDIAASVPVMIELARDTTAPPDVRSEAIWALGAVSDPAAVRALNEISENPAGLFDDPDTDAADLEMARLYVELARMRAGRKDAGRFVESFYRKGSPSNRLTILVSLGYLGIDHALIAEGLQSPDFAVVLGAVRAAHDVAPEKYTAALRDLRDNAFVGALLETQLQDISTLRYYLEKAIRKGEQS